jgi:hypothetical protein
MEVTTIGIDLAKNVFAVCGAVIRESGIRSPLRHQPTLSRGSRRTRSATDADIATRFPGFRSTTLSSPMSTVTHP